jgi:WD40 repeat protein
MPIQITCPECGKTDTVDDTLRGKRLRCKCGKLFEVELDTDEAQTGRIAERPSPPPARSSDRTDDRPRPTRRRDEDDDRDDRPRSRGKRDDRSRKRSKPGMSGAVLSAIIVGGVFVLGGGIGLVVWLSTRHAAPEEVPLPEQVVAQGPPADSKPGNEPPKADTKPAPDGPRFKPKPKDRKGPAAQPPPQSVIDWKVTPDPLPAPVELPADLKGTINIGGDQLAVVYPSAPSAFVCVTQKGANSDAREVWDLRTLKKTGTVVGSNLTGAIALSPDGAYLAGQDRGSNTIQVWSLANGKMVSLYTVIEPFPRDIDIDFLGPDKLLLGVTSDQERVYRVLDFQSKQELQRFTVFAPHHQPKRALSPGGKYLAVGSKEKDRILVYDLTTAELVGQAMLPAQSSSDFHSLAISPDGNRLALLHDQMGKSRVTVWDMATGKMQADHKMATSLQSTAPQGAFYQGPLMEWLDDASGWVFYGSLLVDARGANLYWTIPANKNENRQRRLFGTEHVIRITGGLQSKILRLEKLPAEQIATALLGVRGSGDDGEGLRPALTAPTWSGSKQLPSPTAAAAWQAKADPAPAPKGKLGASRIPLNGKSADLARILFSGPEVGQAAILSAPLVNELSAKQMIKADRYDLATGKHLGTLDLYTFVQPKAILAPLMPDGDLSPDGTLLLVKGPKGKRLDIWSVADGKFLCGFTPLERNSPNVIQYAAFVDEKRVLTLAGKRLILWEVPSCKVIWYLLGVNGLPALSPGHKSVAVCAGSSYDLLDVSSGARLGTLGGPGLLVVGTAAFRPDGKQLAALVSTVEKKNALIRWDVTTGAVIRNSPSAVWKGEMSWAGENHVMIGPVLFDLELGWPVSNYSVAGYGRQANGSPDGRHWYAAAPDKKKPAVLTAQTLPDAASKDLARSVADKTVQVALAPGMKVTPQVSVNLPHEKDSQKQSELVIANRLQGYGFEFGPGAALTLSVQLQGPRPTGEMSQYEILNLSKQKTIVNVSVKALDGVATIRDSQGVLWELNTTYTTPENDVAFTADDVQGELDKRLWNSAAQFVIHLELPSVVLRGPSGLQVLPRPATLASDR